MELFDIVYFGLALGWTLYLVRIILISFIEL